MRQTPLPLEFLLERNGRRMMDSKAVRAMKSKISLKFPLASIVKEKERMRPTIKQSILDEFDKVYADTCDQKK